MLRRWVALIVLLATMLTWMAISPPSGSPSVVTAALVALVAAFSAEAFSNRHTKSSSLLAKTINKDIADVLRSKRTSSGPMFSRRGWSPLSGWARTTAPPVSV